MYNIPWFSYAQRDQLESLSDLLVAVFTFHLLTLYAKPPQDVVVVLLFGIQISEWPDSGKQPSINKIVSKHVKKKIDNLILSSVIR